ncbi:uncharacterized protein [Narcine bancroftii]|uniref:uncharacterized protein n=1 Tax=Narcine bancroftii TaxID=1343680 RepID=UPI0038310C91
MNFPASFTLVGTFPHPHPQSNDSDIPGLELLGYIQAPFPVCLVRSPSKGERCAYPHPRHRLRQAAAKGRPRKAVLCHAGCQGSLAFPALTLQSHDELQTSDSAGHSGALAILGVPSLTRGADPIPSSHVLEQRNQHHPTSSGQIVDNAIAELNEAVAAPYGPAGDMTPATPIPAPRRSRPVQPRTSIHPGVGSQRRGECDRTDSITNEYMYRLSCWMTVIV